MTLTLMGAFTVKCTVAELAMYTGMMLEILKKLNDLDEQTEIDNAIAELMRNTKPNDAKGDAT